ncbi:MAG: CehA/McbA family metallohydrolase [candidate division WOR-3 bacterium]
MARVTPLLLCLLTTLSFGLVPLERDQVLFDGPCPIRDGRAVVGFTLPEGRQPGLYLNVAGLDSFSGVLNGRNVLRAGNEKPRAWFHGFDLSGAPRLPGRNELEILSPGADGNIFVRLWSSDRAWFLSSFHAHTTYSDGAYSVHDLLQRTLAAGAQAYAITDHDTLGQCYDTAFHSLPGLEPIRGTEWTTDSGHACILGLAGATTVEHRSIAQMIDDASYRGGLVQINHPCDPNMEWKHPFLDPGVDLIEVFNSVTWFPEGTDSDAEAVAWWQELLAQGKTIAAVGNADYHGTFPFEEPLKSCTRVFAPSNHPDSILKYAKLGNGMVCDAPDDSRLYLYADTNNNGQWDLVMGDRFTITGSPRTIRFRLEVEDGDVADVVYLYDQNGERYSHTLWTGGDYEYEWTVLFGPDDRNFMRVELCAELGADYEECTNPIYINYPEYELGPVELVCGRLAWPETLYVGREETLQFQVSNLAGVSPYRFGARVAVDTALFDITAWQSRGSGIGLVRNWFGSGYEFVEWTGGYTWENRLAAGVNFSYWLTVRPKRVGRHPVLFRGWADDRLFLIAQDPDHGVPGPEGRFWHQETALVEMASGVESGPAPGGGTGILGVTPTLAREFVEIRLARKDGEAPLRIELLDISGRVCSIINLGSLPQGENTVRLNLKESNRKLRAGVYFLRLVADPADPADNYRFIIAR